MKKVGHAVYSENGQYYMWEILETPEGRVKHVKYAQVNHPFCWGECKVQHIIHNYSRELEERKKVREKVRPGTVPIG